MLKYLTSSSFLSFFFFSFSPTGLSGVEVRFPTGMSSVGIDPVSAVALVGLIGIPFDLLIAVWVLSRIFPDGLFVGTISQTPQRCSRLTPPHPGCALRRRGRRFYHYLPSMRPFCVVAMVGLSRTDRSPRSFPPTRHPDFSLFPAGGLPSGAVVSKAYVFPVG